MLSSIWARFKSYFGWIEGWIYRKWRHRNSRDRKWRHRKRSWPEVTFPEVARTGSDRVRMRNQIPRFFLTIVVVQNVSLRMTDMATGCDVTPNGGSLGRVGCARGAFWRYQTWPRRAFPWKICERPCAAGSICAVLSRTSASYLSFSIPFTGYLPLYRHFISTFNNYTIVCCFRICSKCTPSSLSRPRSHCEGTK
jgi:hypothetical protein